MKFFNESIPLCVVLFGIAILTLACASTPHQIQYVTITPDELTSGTALDLKQDSTSLITEQEVLALSTEMQEFLSTYVDEGANSFVKLNQLVYAIISEGTFGLEYDETSRTAAETFRTRRGNCMSFSNMFVALARSLDLDARYQEVDVPPDWTFNNETYVLNRHVNVYIDFGATGKHVVDFNIDDFKATYDMRTITDQRALAHYYNNIGVDRMQKGDTTAAFFAFQKAIKDNDRTFNPAWTNLGTLYRREKLPAHAEAAYLQALENDHTDLVAMSNLAALYAQLGDQEQAAYYQNRVESHRKQNPYFRYHLAREAFFARDYDAAIVHLKYAVRKRKNEDQFYFLLSLIYLQKGDEKAARQWMDKAEKIAATDALKRNYSNKIDTLLSASE